MLVTKGIVQILWRELAPEIFEYTADCDARGGVLGNSALQRHQHGGAVDVGEWMLNILRACTVSPHSLENFW